MKNRNLLWSISVLCLSLVFAAYAGAQSTGNSPATPDTHAQSAPGTQPSPAPGPSTNSSAGQSSAGSSQSTTAPSTGSASASQGGSNSVEDELQLTQDQKQKIAVVVEDENRQISTIQNDNSLTMPQKQQKVLQIRQEGSPRIKAILTPDQLQKLAVIQQRMRDQQQGGAGQTGTQPAPQSNAPSNSSPQNKPQTPSQSTTPPR